MKRSAINRHIHEAITFFSENRFILPPYAYWTPEQWASCREDTTELRMQRLGWDITDFHSGHFEAIGLTLFTIRNGALNSNGATKQYAEKIMFVRSGQVTPFHYHALKTEDIINRGGKGTGYLALQLYNSGAKGEFVHTPISVICDGIVRHIEPGKTIILGPGESITLPPYLYHTFQAIDGDALIGEVSSANDDDTDNYFREVLPRYPKIIEDEPPSYLLCTEYQTP